LRSTKVDIASIDTALNTGDIWLRKSFASGGCASTEFRKWQTRRDGSAKQFDTIGATILCPGAHLLPAGWSSSDASKGISVPAGNTCAPHFSRGVEAAFSKTIGIKTLELGALRHSDEVIQEGMEKSPISMFYRRYDRAIMIV
jgi:hypothetical protein